MCICSSGRHLLLTNPMDSYARTLHSNDQEQDLDNELLMSIREQLSPHSDSNQHSTGRAAAGMGEHLFKLAQTRRPGPGMTTTPGIDQLFSKHEGSQW
jgi:hypothetical protein